ncbi:crotonase/enoyl-CoA hydratase family protein [Gordonia hydrophobica]|uniref:Crotonase/enoyl-CoA hydratase family protein n=1 Tax=Gordonia hydrophobica TaxID=40516 RepID=A0ABZ2TWM1_9ACTN|nr:crotonase/enoyl-CoA hydratase family protein [Gordonia hydrophobica]MBM7365801.1 enoyl-CoA hydratase/carnithine racemase [Gordonia hydrophobica]
MDTDEPHAYLPPDDDPQAPHVCYTVADGVATILLNRADRLNAFTDRMERELIEAFDRSDADDDVQAVLLTGAGRAFCAGMDLTAGDDPGNAFAEWRSSHTAPPGTQYRLADEDLPLRRDGGGRVVLRIFASIKPIVSAINGHAVGVGATMTLPTDIRIAADSVKFAFPFSRRAFVPESCSSWFLPRLVGPQQALEWMLTGRTFDAAEALAGGLVRSVHPASDVLDVATALVREIVDNTSPVSTSMSRRMLWHMMTAAHPMDAHALETTALNLRGVSDDAREGIEAFLAKRSPHFTDRVSTDTPDVFRRWPDPPFPVPKDLS